MNKPKFTFTVIEPPMVFSPPPVFPWEHHRQPKRKKKKSHSGAAKNRRRKDRLWERDGGFMKDGKKWAQCSYCGIQRMFPLSSLTLDHVRPLSKGGSSKLENLALACELCNAAKGSAER